MRRARTVAVMVALAMSAMPAARAASTARAAAPDALPPLSGTYAPDRILVRFAPGGDAARRVTTLRVAGARAERPLGRSGYWLARLSPETTVAKALADLGRARAVVAHAEPDYTGRVAIDFDDPCVTGCDIGTFTGRQWDIDAVNARAGWNIVPGRTYTSVEKQAINPVKVAVLDTKIDPGFSAADDWANAGAPPNDPWDAANGGQIDAADAHDVITTGLEGPHLYHGTFVAGILGAAANNSAGIAGFGYAAQIMPITVVDGGGTVTADALVEGIDWAYARGARVINLSLGITGASEAVQHEISAVTAGRDGRGTGGALVVAAAGNNGNDAEFYPAQMSQVMSVAATDEADRPGLCSNFNKKVSVAAPGAGIVSLDIRTTSGTGVVGCGTSTATPHVSALAALLFMQDPTRTPAQVRSIIETTADDDRFATGRDDHFGNGRINFERALWIGRARMTAAVLPAQVDRVVTTFPRPLGGVSHATALGFAQAPKVITAAEWRLDTGATGPLFAKDGAFNATSEQLTADIDVPLDIAQGAHRMFARAADSDGWGPWSAGVLLVDRTPPQVTDVAADNFGTPLTPVNVRFKASDDLGSQATYWISVVSQLDKTGTPVYTSSPVTVALPASVTTQWRPGATNVGPYNIVLAVADEGGNVTRATIGTLAL
jgi:hypothetical protein